MWKALTRQKEEAIFLFVLVHKLIGYQGYQVNGGVGGGEVVVVIFSVNNI